MALSSTSTLADVNAAYENNADYDLVESVTKAKDFVVACRFLLRRQPEESVSGNDRTREDYHKVQGQHDDALRWLRANDASFKGSVPGEVFRWRICPAFEANLLSL